MNTSSAPHKPEKRVLRLITTLCCAVLSLLAFPSVLPLVVAAWAAYAIAYKQSAIASIAIGAFIVVLVLLREPTNPFAVGTIIAAAAGLVMVARSDAAHRRRWLFLVLFSTVAFFAQRYLGTHAASKERHEGAVVCLGDSLTSGLPSVGGYPRYLKELIPHDVHDFGREGITIEEATKFVSQIGAVKAATVVVELGGHDFLKKQSRHSTKHELVSLIRTLQKQGSRVILCEVPRGFIFDPFFGIEREIAREMDLDLIPDSMIRKLVLFSPFAPPGMWLGENWRYSDDGLHPNDRGNQMMARTIAKHVQ